MPTDLLALALALLQVLEGSDQCSISGTTDVERLQSAKSLIQQLSRCMLPSLDC